MWLIQGCGGIVDAMAHRDVMDHLEKGHWMTLEVAN
jgi:hypothetical protein